MIEWRAIPDFPNYEINRIGSIRNKKTGKVLSPWNDGKGYLQVDLNGHTIRVHRLIAKIFLSDQYRDDLEVNHIYGIKNNNSLEDLECITHLENMRHAHRTGLIPHNGQGGLARKKVKIIETGMTFESIHACANFIKGEHVHISECLRGLRKTHKGFHFDYIEET